VECFRKAWPSHKAVCGKAQVELEPKSHVSPWPSPLTQSESEARKSVRKRLAFIDFWPGFEDNSDQWFRKDWFETNLKDVDIVDVLASPDVIVFSMFGTRFRQFLSGTSKLVFFTGENFRPPVGKVPLCISFDHIDVDPAIHTRIPLWIFNNEVHDVLALHAERLGGKVNSSVWTRSGFCCFVASNASMYKAEWRKQFVQTLSARYKQVDCGGEVLNNVGGRVKDKISFLRGYRFNVCFENASHPGYCTEKILHAFAAGCVPIYWGDPHACSNSSMANSLADFNPKAFISAHDFATWDLLLQHIERVDNDQKLFESYLREPILADHWYERLKDWSGFCAGFQELLFAGSIGTSAACAARDPEKILPSKGRLDSS